jgi:hypothetical protein
MPRFGIELAGGVLDWVRQRASRMCDVAKRIVRIPLADGTRPVRQVRAYPGCLCFATAARMRATSSSMFSLMYVTS